MAADILYFVVATYVQPPTPEGLERSCRPSGKETCSLLLLPKTYEPFLPHLNLFCVPFPYSVPLLFPRIVFPILLFWTRTCLYLSMIFTYLLVSALAIGNTFTSPPPTRVSAPIVDDGIILNFALTLEFLQRAFYEGALAQFTQADFVAAGFEGPFYTNL